jgi:hypothetical protein
VLVTFVGVLNPAKRDGGFDMKSVRMTKAELEIHDNLVIARFDEGIDLIPEDFVEIKEMVVDNFSGKFAWISDRINSYSIDPTFLSTIAEDLDNLVCLAQVNYGKKLKDSTEIAKDFFPGNVPFRSFVALDDALNWVKKMLRDIGA